MGTQVERVRQEIERMDPGYLKTYVISKAEEFEKLRTQYESQIEMLKGEVRRLGTTVDEQVLQAAKSAYSIRDAQWLRGLEEVPDLKVVVDNGLVNIPETVKMLVARLEAVKS